MSIADAFPFKSAFSPHRSPYRPRGHPPHPLPIGLSEDTIIKLRKRAQRMCRDNNASFPIVFTAKILAALSERGLANLSMKQVMSLAQEAGEMQPDLAVACACFLASHPPVNADFAIMSEAIKRGAVCGPAGLVKLHHHIRDRERKRAAKRRAATPPNPNRPKLLSPAERQQRADAERQKREAVQAAAGKAALDTLYPIRFKLKKPWMLQFVECCQAIADAGYQMVPRNAAQMIELLAEQEEEQAA